MRCDPNPSANPSDDAASRLATASDGNGNVAGYTYLANSALVGQIGFTNGSTRRMVTTKQFDYLNRLTSITNLPSAIGASAIGFAYQYNTANQRTAITNADRTFWLFTYDPLGQVTSGKKYWPDGTPVAGQQFEYNFDDIGNRTSTGWGGDGTPAANLHYQGYAANNLNQYTSRGNPPFYQITGNASSAANISAWSDWGGNATLYRQGNYFRPKKWVS